MSKYLIAVLLTFVSFVSYSESIAVEVPCVTPQDLEQSINKWKELPLARGMSTRSADGQSKNVLVLFVNSKTKTWTIAEKIPTGLYCVLAAGNGFEPMPAEVVEIFKKQQEGL